jgi:hypothetical protein
MPLESFVSVLHKLEIVLLVLSFTYISAHAFQRRAFGKVVTTRSSAAILSTNSDKKLLSTRLHLESGDDSAGDAEDPQLTEAMQNARDCASSGLSPGAGLATADEQADAAYADLINTSMDQRAIDELSLDDVKALQKGGKMWEKDAKQVNKLGLVGDVMKLFGALAGGAHIEKNEFGET